ncbi:MAG: hypothetical protein ACHREM_04220 [Polyangiales bacterium]
MNLIGKILKQFNLARMIAYLEQLQHECEPLTPLVFEPIQLGPIGTHAQTGTLKVICREHFKGKRWRFEPHNMKCLRVISFKIDGYEQLAFGSSEEGIAAEALHDVELAQNPIRPGVTVTLTVKNCSGGTEHVGALLMGTTTRG